MFVDYLFLTLPIMLYVSLQVWAFKSARRRGSAPFGARGGTGAERSMQRRSSGLFLILFPGYAIGWAMTAMGRARKP